MSKPVMRSYRTKHIILVILCIIVCLKSIFSGQDILMNTFAYIVCGVVFLLFERYERKDELVREYLAKANSITVIFGAIAMFATGTIAQEGFNRAVSSDVIFYLCFGIIAFRSMVYLFLDRPAKVEDDNA